MTTSRSSPTAGSSGSSPTGRSQPDGSGPASPGPLLRGRFVDERDPAHEPGPKQQPAYRSARRMLRWALMGVVVAILLAIAAPYLESWSPGPQAIPLVRIPGEWAAAHAGWLPLLALAVAVAIAAAAVPVGAWARMQWHHSRVRGSITRILGLQEDRAAVRAHWQVLRPWLPRRVWARLPSGYIGVNGDPSDLIVALFADKFGLLVAAEYRPRHDHIRIRVLGPAQTPEPEPPRVEETHDLVGGVYRNLDPLLPEATVDQDQTLVNEDGTPRRIVLRYDPAKTTRDTAQRFRTRITSVIEQKVPSPTGAWTIHWHPAAGKVVVDPAAPIPEHRILNQGLPNGWSDRFSLPLGLGSGSRILAWSYRSPHLLVAGPTGGGKALDLQTPIATPTGWTTMGELQAGDQLFDEQGQVCRVLEAHPVRHDRPCYEVVFSDGERIVADGEHRWLTEDRAARTSRFQARREHRREPSLSRDARTTVARLRLREQVTLREVADAAGRRFTPLRLRRIAAELGAVGTTQQEWTFNYSGTIVRRRSPRIPTYPAQPLVDRYLKATSRPLNDQQHRTTGPAVRTTDEIAATLHAGPHVNHTIPVAAALHTPGADLPIPPYVLGCWLGDGVSSSGAITTADPQILDCIRGHGYAVGPPRSPFGTAQTYTIYGLQPQLRALGVLNDKQVPMSYLRASVGQRRELLAGLLDTDGTIGDSGKLTFCSTRRSLAEATLELVLSLGYRGWMTEGTARLRGKDCGPKWNVGFTTRDDMFTLERKRATHQQRTARHSPERTRQRYIVDVRPVPSRPVRCISVDSPTRLYLAGRHMVPTHNSSLMRTVLVMASLLGWRIWIVDPKKTGFSSFRDWPGVERVATSDAVMRQTLLDYRDELEDVHDQIEEGRLRFADLVPIILIFDEMSEGLDVITDYVDEHFEEWKQAAKQEDPPRTLRQSRENRRAPDAAWRVIRLGRQALHLMLIGIQRPDTNFIPGSARDNLVGRAAAGELGGDGLEMVFGTREVTQRVHRTIVDTASGDQLREPIPGRMTVNVGHGPEPLQAFYTPDPAPGEHTDDEARLLQSLYDQAHHAVAARRAHQDRIAAQGRVVGPDEVGYTPMADEEPPGDAAGQPDRAAAEHHNADQHDNAAQPAGAGPGAAGPRDSDPAGASATPEPEDGNYRVLQRLPARDLEPGFWVRIEIDGDEFNAEVIDVSDESSDEATVAVDYHTPDGELGGVELDAAEHVTRIRPPQTGDDS